MFFFVRLVRYFYDDSILLGSLNRAGYSVVVLSSLFQGGVREEYVWPVVNLDPLFVIRSIHRAFCFHCFGADRGFDCFSEATNPQSSLD